MRQRFPPTRARLALSQYAAARGMCAAGALSGWVKPHKGLAAGCPFAADILQTFFAESIEELASSTVQVRMCVDDNHIRSTGQGPALVGNIVAAADFWRDEVARLGVWLLTLTSRHNLSMDCRHSALRSRSRPSTLGSILRWVPPEEAGEKRPESRPLPSATTR